MFLAEDVNSQAEIEETVADSKVKEAELDLARQVIDSLAGEFDEAELTSEYRTNLRQMLEAKLSGQEITKPVEAPTETPVVDLMEALKQSVAEVSGKKQPAKRARAAPKSGSRKRVPARKSA
jgi:DNA end-binding protein Ku